MEQILNELITFSKPIEYLEQRVLNLPWDIDTLVVLKYSDLKNIFEKYLTKIITAKDVERWAELIEVRDGIDYEERDNLPNIKDIIFQLANPDINSEITVSLITNLSASIEENP